VGDHSSGDLFLGFSTGNTNLPGDGDRTQPLTATVSMLNDSHISLVYDAVVDATEEAIVNALVAAETMVGRDGHTAHALPRDHLSELVSAHRQAMSRLEP